MTGNVDELSRKIAAAITSEPAQEPKRSVLKFADQADRVEPGDEAGEFRQKVATAIGHEPGPRVAAGGLRWAC